MLIQFPARMILRLLGLTLLLGALLMPLTMAEPARAESGKRTGVEQQTTWGPFVAPKKVGAIFGLDEGGELAVNEMTRNLAAGTGVNWVRITIEWDSIEAVRGVYDFTGADNYVNSLANKGFTLMAFISRNPAWAASEQCGPIDTRDQSLVDSFGAMMGVLAARYPQVKVWSLYNEVDYDGTPAEHNAGCFGSRTAGGVNDNGIRDVDEYAIMLATAWKAVHTANPKALVGAGAISFDNFNTETAPPGYPGGGQGGAFNYNFIGELANTMKNNPRPAGEKFMDVLLFNYYDIYGTYYWKKVASGEGVQAKASVLRQTLSQAGITGVKLFVGETGSDSSVIGDAGQSRCLYLNMVRGAAAKMLGIIWWTFKDFGDDAPSPRNTWKYGVVDQHYQPKLSYHVLQGLVRELDGYKFKGTLSDQAGFQQVEAYRFLKGSSTKYVIVSSSIKPNQVHSNCVWSRNNRIATFNATTVRQVSFDGKAKIITDNSNNDKDPAAGRIGIKVGTNPLMIQVNP